MNKPIVTVVIPIFNSQESISETLDSVVSQSLKNWEVICVDDGSKDNSVGVVERYINDHKGYDIKIIRRESVNKGGSVCRNIGGKAAKGDFIIFLDADDLLAPTCLEKRVAVMKDEKLQFSVFPMAGFVNNDLNTATMYSRLYVRDPLYFFASGFGTWQVTSPILRKAFFDRLNGFDESFPRLQDVEFHIRAIVESKGNYVVMQNSEADCYYRLGGSSEVKVEKLKRAIIGCNRLLYLIDRYSKKGVFKNEKKFALSLLSLFCHLSMYQDMIIEKDKSFYRTNFVLESDLRKYLGNMILLLIHMIDHIPGVKTRLFVTRIVDKLVRSKLAK